MKQRQARFHHPLGAWAAALLVAAGCAGNEPSASGPLVADSDAPRPEAGTHSASAAGGNAAADPEAAAPTPPHRGGTDAGRAGGDSGDASGGSRWNEAPGSADDRGSAGSPETSEEPANAGGRAGAAGASSSGGSSSSHGGARSPGGAGSGGSAAAGGSPGGSVKSLPCEVRIVLKERCQICHQDPPLNDAPMPLLTWYDVVAKAGDIQDKLDNDEMPPRGQVDLSERQLSTLLTYLALGTPSAGNVSCP